MSCDKHYHLTHDSQLHTSDRVIPPTINTKIRVPVMVGSVLAILSVGSLAKVYSRGDELVPDANYGTRRIMTSTDLYTAINKNFKESEEHVYLDESPIDVLSDLAAQL